MQRPPAEDVQVDVEDRLASVGVAVEDGAEAALAMTVLAREAAAAPHHLAHQPVVCRP